MSNCKDQILRFADERGLGPVDFVEDSISGTVDWKQRELGFVLSQLQPGDAVITAVGFLWGQVLQYHVFLCRLRHSSTTLRIEYPGVVYHVTVRGNARMLILEDDDDRAHLLNLTEERSTASIGVAMPIV